MIKMFLTFIPKNSQRGTANIKARPLARSGLVGSRVGHAAGVLNYALIGVVVTDRSTGLHLLPEALLHGLFCLVPVYSALAIATRLVAAPGRPASALGR